MVVEWSTVVELEHPWYQGVKLFTAPLNQRRTTTFDQRAPAFVPTLVSFPDLKHFPKMLPGPRNGYHYYDCEKKTGGKGEGGEL